MKKVIIFLILIALSGVMSGCGFANTENSKYLRIHIRANSDSASDQEIKLVVRDSVIEYLSPLLRDTKTSNDAEKIILSHKSEMTNAINELLYSCGYYYGCEILIKDEFFAEKSYGNLTLKEGYYRAVIVNLGTGKGQNWWCVAYPPLCFTLGEGYENLNYKSILYEVVKKYLSEE